MRLRRTSICSDCAADAIDQVAMKLGIAQSKTERVKSPLARQVVVSKVTGQGLGLIEAIGLTLFGLILSLVVFEIAFRVFGGSSRALKTRNDRPAQYFFNEITQNTRNAPYSLLKPRNTYRIVVVGDSFTYGPGLELDDTFSNRLERILNLRKDGPKAQVLNFGVPGYSTAQEVPLVERAIKLQSDLIILQVTLNDTELQPFRVTNPDFDMNGRVHLDAPIFKWWKSLAFVYTRIQNTLSHRRYKQYYLDLYNNPDTWNRFEESIKRIKQLSASTNTPLAVVVFPLFSHPLDHRYPFKSIHRKIDEMLKDNHIRRLDLLGAYQNMSPSRLQILPGQDSHPNEIAHRIAAENIYLWLERHHVLPDNLRVSSRKSNMPIDPLNYLNRQFSSSKANE